MYTLLPHFTDEKNEVQGECPFPNAGNESNKRNRDTSVNSLFQDYILPTFWEQLGG